MSARARRKAVDLRKVSCTKGCCLFRFTGRWRQPSLGNDGSDENMSPPVDGTTAGLPDLLLLCKRHSFTIREISKELAWQGSGASEAAPPGFRPRPAGGCSGRR